MQGTSTEQGGPRLCPIGWILADRAAFPLLTFQPQWLDQIILCSFPAVMIPWFTTEESLTPGSMLPFFLLLSFYSPSTLLFSPGSFHFPSTLEVKVTRVHMWSSQDSTPLKDRIWPIDYRSPQSALSPVTFSSSRFSLRTRVCQIYNELFVI